MQSPLTEVGSAPGGFGPRGFFLGRSLACAGMSQKRVHILSTVNAANVSKAGSVYTIRDVCGAVDGIVMNRMAYPGDQLAAGAASLEGKPAPAGHPKNAAGQFISAANGEALFHAYVGAYAKNARHEGGRTLVDVVVNEAQAKAHPDGAKLIERLDAAIANTNAEPIHVSTGLYCEPITANGESNGKPYDRIATQIRYDHLAILLNERGAGTPEDGVGMFLNAAGQPEEVETVTVNTAPEDKRSAGLMRWVNRLLGNGSGDLSFDAITSRLYEQLQVVQKDAWLREVFDRYAIWTAGDGRLWKQDYTVSSDGSVAFAGTAVEVTRKVQYEPVTNQERDPMKDQILAALNAAGIAVAGLDDAALLTAYNALQAKPHKDALVAANSQLAAIQLQANAAADAELTALATELAVNTSLKPEDFKAMGLARCKELKANAKAAPVLPGAAGMKAGDEFASYDINEHLKEGK